MAYVEDYSKSKRRNWILSNIFFLGLAPGIAKSLAKNNNLGIRLIDYSEFGLFLIFCKQIKHGQHNFKVLIDPKINQLNK